MANIKVSAQAFLQEIESWKSTLNRQVQKLRQLKNSVRNKFKLNSIDIVLTEIESMQIKYKKIKNKYHPFTLNENLITTLQSLNERSLSDELLNQYSQLSKIFMEILEKISLIDRESDQPNYLIENYPQQREIVQQQNQSRKKCSNPLLNHQVSKTFLNDTFAFKVGKEQKVKNSRSIFQKRKSNRQHEQIGLVQNSNRMKTHSMLAKVSDVLNTTAKNQKQHAKQKPTSKQHYQTQCPPPQQQFENSNSLWQIRHQLQTITQMMKEMKYQIQFHQHEQSSKQINKIETKNRKMASQLKSIKEQNRLILQKIAQLKSDLIQEKRSQVDMINRFQKRSGNSKYNLYDSIATHADNYVSIEGDKSTLTNRKSLSDAQNVSDWVRMRI